MKKRVSGECQDYMRNQSAELLFLCSCWLIALKTNIKGKCATKKTFWRAHTTYTFQMITNCILPAFDQGDKSWLRKGI